MGILNSLLNGMAKYMAEAAWPGYQQACTKDEHTICSWLENETNYFRKTVWLLALSRKNTYKARDYYFRNQKTYNNQLENLRQYNRFERDIDIFIRNMGDKKSAY